MIFLRRLCSVILFVFWLLTCESAFAAKARSIASVADSAYHAEHLRNHLGETTCHGTGNYIKTRNKANGNKVIGHLEQADEFILLDVKNGWTQIEVVYSDKTSPDSWEGMTGWVNSDYIDCICSTSEYTQPILFNSLDSYESILHFFYQAIVEQWDFQEISSRDFEPYDFPNNLDNSGFVYWDINSDGIEELFILRRADSEISPILVGYTLVNEKPVRIFTSWARSRKHLCIDGSIYNVGSNGASYSVNYIYDLVGSHLIVREGVLSGDYVEDGITKYGWFLVTDEADFSYSEYPLIPDQEAANRIADYQANVVKQFDNFISFAEWANTL